MSLYKEPRDALVPWPSCSRSNPVRDPLPLASLLLASLTPCPPGLASATNTRVDSACKHIQQCRVSTDDMLQYTGAVKDMETLEREKYRYCIHKDECVIGIGRAWWPDDSRKRTNNAYPRVISNLGSVSPPARPRASCVRMTCGEGSFPAAEGRTRRCLST